MQTPRRWGWVPAPYGRGARSRCRAGALEEAVEHVAEEDRPHEDDDEDGDDEADPPLADRIVDVRAAP